jgi:hypothetical protein
MKPLLIGRARNLIIIAFFFSFIIPSLISAQTISDSLTTQSNLILLAEGTGFIPFSQSYRINYQTSLAGLPIEIAGGICFPINASLSSMFEVRYKRRTAVFIQDFRIKTLEIELGVRDYLEKEHEKDLRLYGSAGLLLVRSIASGNIDATADGTMIVKTEVSKEYYNIGLGLGLGVEYPISQVSGIYAGIHLGIYFADPVVGGGLGNVGGMSIGLGYKLTLVN